MEGHRFALGVVADDIAGAAIAGAALGQSGVRVTVATDNSGWDTRAEAIVVSTNAREIVAGPTRPYGSPEDLVSSYVRRLRTQLRCRRIELRIDAALRRDYSTEVSAAVLAARMQDPLVLAVMAMPSAGRITKDGLQITFMTGGGQIEHAVAERVFGEDASALVGTSVVQQGPNAIVEAIEEVLPETRRFVVDAGSEEHLRAIATAAQRLEQSYHLLTVSSGAWLRYRPALALGSGFVLVAVGLPTEPTEAQVAQLLKSPSTRIFTVSQALQLALEPQELVEQVRDAQSVIVKISPEEHGSEEPYSDLARIEAAGRVAEAASAVLAATRRSGLCCSGAIGAGAYTAARLVRELAASRLVPLKDGDAHIPIAYVADGDWIGLKVAMKGGLVGTPDALADLVRRLNDSSGEPR